MAGAGVSSYSMTSIRGPKLLRRAWIAAMLIVLLGAYLSVGVGEGTTELYQWTLIGGSIALTFPSGLIVHLGGSYAAMYIANWVGRRGSNIFPRRSLSRCRFYQR